MSRLILISLILALAGAGPAWADDEEEDYARNGFYASFSIAGTHYTQLEDDAKRDIEATGFSGSVDTEGPLGIDIRAGYRFHPHLSADVDFLWFTKSVTRFSGTTALNPNIKDQRFDLFKVETLNVLANLKGYVLTGRIQPFLVVGGGLMHAKVDDKLNLNTVNGGDAFLARFGGGVDVYLTSNFVAVLEGDYMLPTGKLNGLNSGSWSVGLEYRF